MKIIKQILLLMIMISSGLSAMVGKRVNEDVVEFPDGRRIIRGAGGLEYTLMGPADRGREWRFRRHAQRDERTNTYSVDEFMDTISSDRFLSVESPVGSKYRADHAQEIFEEYERMFNEASL